MKHETILQTIPVARATMNSFKASSIILLDSVRLLLISLSVDDQRYVCRNTKLSERLIAFVRYASFRIGKRDLIDVPVVAERRHKVEHRLKEIWIDISIAYCKRHLILTGMGKNYLQDVSNLDYTDYHRYLVQSSLTYAAKQFRTWVIEN